MSTDPARTRFFVISLGRLLGVAFVFAGLLIVNGAIEWPALAGYLLVAAGMAGVFLLPLILARKWRTRE